MARVPIIELLFANGGAVTNVVYFACIMEGNQVDYLKAQAFTQTKSYLADNLQDGYIADFSNKGYELLTGNQKFSDTTLTNYNMYKAKPSAV